MRRALLLALPLLPLSAMPAWSQTTPEQAQALKAQIQDWVATLAGPDLKLPPLPVEVMAEGDHYKIAIPLGDSPDAPKLTGAARGPQDGRWSIQDVRLPSPAEFSYDLPNGPDGKPNILSYKFTFGAQATQMLIDPTLKTASTSTSSLRDLDLEVQSPHMQQSGHVKLGSSNAILEPTTNGRVNFSLSSSIEGYETHSQTPKGPMDIGIGAGKVAIGIADIAPERLVEMIHLAGKLSAMPKGAANKAQADQLAEAMLAAFSDFATGISFDETLEGFDLGMMGMKGSLQGLRVGFGLHGSDGLLQAHLDLGARGLTLPPDLPLGPMAELIPTKLTLRPTVTGVPADVLVAMVRADMHGQKPGPREIQALFAHGPIVAGIENLSLAIAGAELTGGAKVNIAGPTPQLIDGTGQISITNMDRVQQTISAHPELAQGLPVFIFLKGIGRANGSAMVWDIAFRDQHLFVNGQDMNALTGGGQAQEPAPQAAPQHGAPQPLLRRRQ